VALAFGGWEEDGTTAIVSSSASLQPGAGPGRGAMATAPALTASSTST
jgi:hypothetical protein